MVNALQVEEAELALESKEEDIVEPLVSELGAYEAEDGEKEEDSIYISGSDPCQQMTRRELSDTTYLLAQGSDRRAL